MLQQLMGRAAEAHKHGRFDEAEGLYLQVLQTRPDLFEAQHSLGVLRGQQGRHEEALALFEAALRVHPDAAGVLVNCGMVLHNLKRHTEALASFDKALAISPDYALALNNRGPVLSALGRDRDALKSYIAALAVRPDYADAYNNMGGLLTELGRLDDAKAALHRALELNPRLMGAYVNLGKCKIFTADDPHLAAMQALERDMGLSKADRTRLHFALGKAYADIKDHNRAFESLSHGNALKRAQIVYDEAATLRLFKSTEATFTRDLVSAKAGFGDPSAVPVFILGMPRSGTTLVEQILASHRDVHGGGEHETLTRLVRTMRGPDGTAAPPYPDFVASAAVGSFRAIGAGYAAELRRFAPDARRVTDKVPQNFFLAGLIHLALPNARIIHVIRDPVDTCVSCFSTLFTAGQHHTYNLAELGRYHRHYQTLMAHWRNVLPHGRIFEVRYEDIVADLEKEVRRILAHCDLDWDPRCLEFHQTERPVHTASARQVRQPIYKSAIGRGRIYEPHLGPLLAELNSASV